MAPVKKSLQSRFLKMREITDMPTRQKASLAQFLQKPSPSNLFEQLEAEKKSGSTPFFDEVVEGATGTESFESLLSKITGPVDPATIPNFPTPQCLTPEQIYDRERIGEEHKAHLATCPWCKNMMVAANPTNEEFEEICRKAKAAATAQSRNAAG